MSTYKVTGEYHKVLGHSYGETFDADLDEDQEARLIQAGHIARLPDKTTKKTDEAAAA